MKSRIVRGVELQEEEKRSIRVAAALPDARSSKRDLVVPRL